MSMEKITLKPATKELIYRTNEEGVHFDVLSYQGTGNQEKALGSFFLVGQAKYPQEEMSYAISLISSLAKREYHSEQSIQSQNAKKAFEYTLNKLNEVLDDFFKNKGFKLNIGLIAISGNDIYLSRLGKFKVALARDGKYIDVLNNVDLFSKDGEDAKQFSNIISGKLFPQDKLFAYFPTRSITVREAQLNNIFVEEDQNTFSQKIANLASNTNSFSCCGVHISMAEVKEIPIEARSGHTRTVLTNSTTDNQSPRPFSSSDSTPKPKATKVDEPDAEIPKPEIAEEAETNFEEPTAQESPRIIPAEFSLTKRVNPLSSLFNKITGFKKIQRPNINARSNGFLFLIAVILLPFLIFVFYRATGPSSEVKKAISQAQENLRLAQSQLNQKNTKEARSLLQATLLNTASLTNKKISDIRSQISQTLGNVNKTSDKQPQLYLDLSSNKNAGPKVSLITASTETISVTDQSGTIFLVTQSNVSKLSQLKTTPKFLFNTAAAVSIFNGSNTFGVYTIKSQKTSLYSLQKAASASDAVLYQDNLYTLSNNHIYKYADVSTGGVSRNDWGNDTANGTLVAISADGNVYAINNNGKIIKYFKGKDVGELDLQVVPASGSRIFTFSAKDGSASGGNGSAFLYLADKTDSLVYVFDKTSGELKTTYGLTAVGQISDISVSPNGSIWILSADNKIWVIK